MDPELINKLPDIIQWKIFSYLSQQYLDHTIFKNHVKKFYTWPKLLKELQITNPRIESGYSHEWWNYMYMYDSNIDTHNSFPNKNSPKFVLTHKIKKLCNKHETDLPLIQSQLTRFNMIFCKLFGIFVNNVSRDTLQDYLTSNIIIIIHSILILKEEKSNLFCSFLREYPDNHHSFNDNIDDNISIISCTEFDKLYKQRKSILDQI